MAKNVIALRKKNLEILSKRFPHLADELKQPVGGFVAPIRDESGLVVDIDIGGKRLYGEDGRVWCKRQVEEYCADPDRLALHNLGYANPSEAAEPLILAIGEWIGKNKVELALEPVRDVGFFYAIGLGLGFYLSHVIEKKLARVVLIVENNPDFLRLSLEAFDWGALLDAADRDKIIVEMHCLAAPEEIRPLLDRQMAEHTNALLDGSYSFAHYYSYFSKTCKEKIVEAMKICRMSAGFYEDEIIMMRNTYMNLLRHDCRIIDTRKKFAQKMPAFIVASGPSLDDSLEVVKTWRDRAVVCSCGTALGILLKNGIVPDFHAEHENSWPLFENLSALKKEVGDFQDVTLLASTTVRPETPTLFDETWFFYRSALSSAYLLRDERYQPLPGAAPMNANAASACMVAMGFKEIYLFGVDCGQREGRLHHSRQSPYFQEGHFLAERGGADSGILHGRDIKGEGNFGGAALSSWALYTSALQLGAMFKNRSGSVYNCSDGLRIEGTVPKAAAAVSLAHIPAGSHRQGKQFVRGQLTAHVAGALLENIPLASYVEDVEIFRQETKPLLTALRRRTLDTYEAVKIAAALERIDLKAGGAGFRIAGSCVTSMVRLAAMGGNRIADDAIRDAFYAMVADKMEELLGEIADRLKAFYQKLAARSSEVKEEDYFVAKTPKAASEVTAAASSGARSANA